MFLVVANLLIKQTSDDFAIVCFICKKINNSLFFKTKFFSY